MPMDALYAYAVLPEGAELPAGAPAILPGAAHALVSGGGCAALVSPVPSRAFGRGPEGRLGDPAWMAERERAHRGAIAAAAARGPVLPLAFGAIFSGPAPLVAWLDASGPRLRAALAGPPGDRTVAAELSRSLALRLAREARLLAGAGGGLAEDASLDDLRAEIARIGHVLATPDLARRLTGAA